MCGGGYSDNFENYTEITYDSSQETHASEEINNYADLIGKRLVAWENKDPLVNRWGHSGDTAKEVVIVGVYNIPNASSRGAIRQTLLEPKVIRSQSWQTVREQRNCYIQAMFAPDISDILDKQFVEKCLDVTETMLASFNKRNGEKSSNIIPLAQ